MDRSFTIYYTSDIHGYFSPVDYAAALPATTGLANCAANFIRDGNSLIIDGGDTLQGSPFTFWLQQNSSEECIPARLMNLAGYQFVTLGNHDFNYGREVLERYLNALDARCLCANVSGLSKVDDTAVATLENGLRIGITGITTGYIPHWEKPENLSGITVTDPVEAARTSLRSLREKKVDVTVCIYHGGFEADLRSGRLLSATDENQAWKICQELDYDILLTGHQHMPLEHALIRNTWTCQPPDKARSFIRIAVSVSDTGTVRAESRLLPAGEKTLSSIQTFLTPLEQEVDRWLDTPVGTLDVPLHPDAPLQMALHGSLISNFFNQVQLSYSKADLSSTCLGNEVRGFERNVSIRDVVATYIYPNSLVTVRVNRSVLKQALERSAEYFSLDAAGNPCVSEHFLHPKVEHYNFDYIFGIEADIDISRPFGDRVLSIRYQGTELEEGRQLILCLNNYRASGSGEYPFYADCEHIKESSTEIVELIMDYVMSHPSITVDKHRCLNVYCSGQLLS